MISTWDRPPSGSSTLRYAVVPPTGSVKRPGTAAACRPSADAARR
ncbi:hypothetical protein ACFW2D_37295 [Streptomyces sp. NPDC058914]